MVDWYTIEGSKPTLGTIRLLAEIRLTIKNLAARYMYLLNIQMNIGTLCCSSLS